MRQVHVAEFPPEAHMIKGFLETAGITAVVQGDAVSSVRGGVPMDSNTLPSVWVADDDFEQAEQLVQDFLHDDPVAPGATQWTCPNCGENLEPQFTSCWQCGTSRVD